MAEKSDVRREQAIVWKTETSPLVGARRVSSVFSLLGATWQLEMEHSFPDGYELCLRRIGNSGPTTPFSVITSVQSTGPLAASVTYRSHKVNITEPVSNLWACGTKKITLSNVWSQPEVTVVCVFTDISSATSGVLNEPVEVMTQTSEANVDSLSHDFGKLLEDKVIPDVNLRCGNHTIAAHKAILAARSQVFAAMFQSKMSESETGDVDIADVDVQVLEVFLKYAYSGRLTDVPDELLPSLYAVGDKYAVSSLKMACSERMIYNLTPENCLDVLILANTHSDQDLKNGILDFILYHVEILKSQEWTKFSKGNLALSNEVFQFVVQRKLF